jgi:flagellar hook-basal body complex protein FliE
MNTSVEINRILSQIRAMEQMTAADRVQPKGIVDLQGAESTTSFSGVFKQAINQVNDLAQESSQLSQAYVRGDAGVDISRVMVASQKSSLATSAMIQVRNKMLESYKEIMGMSV